MKLTHILINLIMVFISISIFFPIALNLITQSSTQPLLSNHITTSQSHLNNRSEFPDRRTSTTITQQSPQLPISANHLLVNILFPLILIIFVIAIILTIFSHKDFDE